MTEQELIEQAINSGTDSTGRLGGQTDNQHVYWDEKGPYNKKVGGGKMYIAPLAASSYDDPKMQAWAEKMGVKVDRSDPTNHPGGQVLDTGRPSGGLLHESGTWDPNSGQWDQGLDWGNILTMVVAGVMTAGVASAMMTSAGVPAAVADSAVNAAATTGSAEAGLSTMGPLASGLTGATTEAAVPASLAAGSSAATAAGVGAGEMGATVGLASGAGLPGAAAIPTVGDLAGVGSSIAGQSGVGSLLTSEGTAASTASKIAGLLSKGGQAIGAATNAAENNQLTRGILGLQRSSEEDKQRRQALSDVYRANWYQTRQPGPYDPKPLQTMTPAYMDTLQGLSDQGKAKLSKPAQYDTSNLPSLDPSTMQQIGSWLGPGLSTLGTIAKLF